MKNKKNNKSAFFICNNPTQHTLSISFNTKLVGISNKTISKSTNLSTHRDWTNVIRLRHRSLTSQQFKQTACIGRKDDQL